MQIVHSTGQLEGRMNCNILLEKMGQQQRDLSFCPISGFACVGPPHSITYGQVKKEIYFLNDLTVRKTMKACDLIV